MQPIDVYFTNKIKKIQEKEKITNGKSKKGKKM